MPQEFQDVLFQIPSLLLICWLCLHGRIDFMICGMTRTTQLAAEYSECPSGKKGGDLGWFPRGKMAGPFQEVAFNTQPGVCTAPFKST